MHLLLISSPLFKKEQDEHCQSCKMISSRVWCENVQTMCVTNQKQTSEGYPEDPMFLREKPNIFLSNFKKQPDVANMTQMKIHIWKLKCNYYLMVQ